MVGVNAAAAELARAARTHDVRVGHNVVEMRADRAGPSINNPLMAYVTKNPNQDWKARRMPILFRISPEDSPIPALRWQRPNISDSASIH